MKNRIATLFFIFLFFNSNIISQDIIKLHGSPIGSPNVDYGTGQPSSTVNTVSDVFDGNFNTYYASYERSYTWVGLDLGKKNIITKIGFSPRKNWSQRLELGVFEGANNSDFGDAVPIDIITQQNIEENKLTYVDINCSSGF